MADRATNLGSFRRQIFDALQAARNRWRDARLFLFYAPGFDDPLNLAKPEVASRRDTALVTWGRGAGYEQHHRPRLIEFDCRRVAPYLLETDPAFDDPLLEESITHAFHDLSAAAPEPDGEEGTGRALCGWLASTDSGETIARRFSGAAERLDPSNGGRYWLRWYDPRMMALLWPGMTDHQKTALLGERLTWLAFDAAGHLVEFSSPASAASFAPTHTEPLQRLLQTPQVLVTQPQWNAVHHVGLVNRLVEAWREQRGQPLPRDATDVVYREVLRAEGWGLGGRDLHVFVLTAVELRSGFEADAGLRAAVGAAARDPGTLADRIAELPPGFWARYAVVR